MIPIVISVFMAVVISIVGATYDPCDISFYLDTSNGKRRFDRQLGPIETPLCDTYIVVMGNWYRISDGAYNRLAEGCQRQWYCGTQIPIWMNGTHPTIAEGEVTRQVCAGTRPQCNCIWSDTVQVKQCQGSPQFFVYRLVAPPGCDLAYCVASPPCPPGQVRHPNSDMCVDQFPKLTTLPELIGPEITPYNERIQFRCKVHYTGSDPFNQERFRVTFLFDNQAELAPIDLDLQDLEVYLPETDLSNRMGKTLTCQVETFWAFNTNDLSDPVLAKGYWIGVEVPIGLNISEADDTVHQLPLKSTLPIVNGLAKDVRLTTRIVTPGLSVNQVCDHLILRDDWREAEERAYSNRSIKIRTKRDPLEKASKTFLVEFVPYDTLFSGPRIWHNYQIQSVLVHYQDAPYAMCKLVGTTFTTFDRPDPLSLTSFGEFVMFKSAARRVYEVQLRTKFCYIGGTQASCACAVAVREGNALVTIDRCHVGKSGQAYTYIYTYNQKLPGGAGVARDARGTQFSLNMPSGAHVAVELDTTGMMNVYVYAIAEDRNKASGLCGNNNGDPSDDVTTTFHDHAESYRIPVGQSFMDTQPPADPTLEPEDATYCECSENVVNCAPSLLTAAANTFGTPDNKVVPDVRGVNTVSGRRRLLQQPSGNVEPALTSGGAREVTINYEFDYGETREPIVYSTSWPTPRGLTEEGARAACTQALMALPMYRSCNNTVGVDMGPTVRTCMLGIQSVDSEEVAFAYVSSLQETCTFATTTNPDLYQEDGNGDQMPREALLEDYCPNHCSNHGSCKDRSCTCDEDYIGSDCAVARYAVPTLHAFTSGDRCDVSKPCDDVGLLATNFTDSPGLSCRVTFLSWTGVEGPMVVNMKPTIRTSTEIICTLPRSPLEDAAEPSVGLTMARHKWRVSLSNDGDIYGNAMEVLVWDSTCLQCDGSLTECPQKPNTCLIGGRCFVADEINPAEGCQVCKPQISSNSFSPLEGNLVPVYNGTNDIFKFRGETLTFVLDVIDPEGSELTFSMPMIHAGVSITSEGVISFDDTVDTNMTMVIKVKDTCNGIISVTLRLFLLPCPCHNGGTCQPIVDPDPSHSEERHTCACADSFTGSNCDTPLPCRDDPCNNGGTCVVIDKETFRCMCTEGYEGLNCNSMVTSSTPMPSSPTTASTDPCSHGVWTAWTPFSDCNKDCDYGLVTRRRNCSCPPCQGVSSESEICAATPCTEAEKEKYLGVLIVLTFEDQTDMVLKMDDLENIVRQELNRMCSIDPKLCCGHPTDGWISNYATFIPKGKVFLANGYPLFLAGETQVTVKLLGAMPSSTYRALCNADTNRVKRALGAAKDPVLIPRDLDASDRPVDSVVLEDATLNILSRIEQELGVEVVSVRAVERRPPTPGFPWWPIAVAVGCAALIAIVITVIVKKYKGAQRKRPVEDKDPVLGSQASVQMSAPPQGWGNSASTEDSASVVYDDPDVHRPTTPVGVDLGIQDSEGYEVPANHKWQVDRIYQSERLQN